jgi:uncharacterized protein
MLFHSGTVALLRSAPKAFLPFLALLICGVVFAEVPVPELRSPVTDLTGTLTADQVAQLDRRLRDFEARKGSQIAVLLVPTTQPETIEQYSIRVAEAWKLGRKGVEDGVLLLVAKDDRAVRIEVGYGLEGAVPDVLANRIVEQVIVPRFRQGEFFGGINAALDRIIALAEGEPLPEAERRAPPAQGPSGIGSAFPLLLMLLIVGGGILRRIFGGAGGAFVTGGLAGVIVWFLTGALAIAVGAAIIGFVFTLMGGGFGGGFGGGRRRGWYGGGLGGGGWGGGSWGGGGGGGWSGGGGGFGGGGASGRW